MSFAKLFESGNTKPNIAHFAAIANIAAVDGIINEEEEKLLARFAMKLDIDEDLSKEILKNLDKYPIPTTSSKQERLEYIYELFRMIFADHSVNEVEMKMIYRYAIGLGCSHDRAKDLIFRSVKIFNGEISFEDYQTLVGFK
ncbi:TerB family tellurite resistance protein [Sediminicola luteus]|uniref:Uncharacterized protein n=1 Tax=Sediminicola luteus TaxID=319238 RepID=A0A2A4G3I1_9FLAO|nr:TerB family tellurite resistance protein [Sediminicola luteus]PCE62983.1 hypothetical protein B7P33_17050 [Sediminicola luteus]